jgi:heme-degrading monooxygenase HmoA
MHVRITWGRINPGSWSEYEAAFREGVEASPTIDGLIARVLARDVDDPDTGYSISWWDSIEAMDSYEGSREPRNEMVSRVAPYFAGAYVTNTLEVVLEKRYQDNGNNPPAQ